MAKWFKELPVNLKNGADRLRSVSESGSQPRANKAALVLSVATRTPSCTSIHPKSSSPDAAGVGCLLSGRSRKNTAADPSRSGSSSPKDGKVWDGLLPGKSRRSPRADAHNPEQHRARKGSPSYISRLIRVDKLDKSPNFNGSSITSEEAAEALNPAPAKSHAVIIVEDYADPFDAQRTREQREAERSGENDGYMEPYDAQQMISEIRRRGSKDLLKVCVLAEAGEERADEGRLVAPQTSPPPHQGSGQTPATRPQAEPRPPAEHEVAREWNKERLARALSAQLDGADRPAKDERARSTLPRRPVGGRQQRHVRQKSWTQKMLRSSPTADADACCVDPSLPLEKQSWYHGCVTRQEAEVLLQACREASFLVRNSESGSSKYSIALKTSQGCVHIIVAQTKGNGYTLDQSRCVFPSIPEVVHHYCSQRLPFNGAEHMTLLHPVPRVH